VKANEFFGMDGGRIWPLSQIGFNGQQMRDHFAQRENEHQRATAFFYSGRR
jgi:hypothetical protein